jgi:Transcription factor regulating root and shoot growth via Pin3
MAERMPQGTYEKAESKPTQMLSNTNGTHQLRNSTSNQDNSQNETSKEAFGKAREAMASDDAKKVSELGRNGDNGSRAQSLLASTNQEEKEWIEQYEPGVYITLVSFHDGTRDLKRVRFR